MRREKTTLNVVIPEDVVEAFVDKYLSEEYFNKDVIWYEGINTKLYINLTVEEFVDGSKIPDGYEDEWE